MSKCIFVWVYLEFICVLVCVSILQMCISVANLQMIGHLTLYVIDKGLVYLKENSFLAIPWSQNKLIKLLYAYFAEFLDKKGSCS